MSVDQAPAMKRTLAEVVEQRKKELSPGRMFVEAYREHGPDTLVEYPVTITDSLTSSRRKPRYPARNMLKVIDLARDPRRWYWHESLPDTDDLRPELASRFYRSEIPPLLPTTAWVQIPDGLADEPDTFESFVNYRLIVRLATAENHTILVGDGTPGSGLLNMPDIARITAKKGFTSTILAACDEVEQKGCTADGLILNPVDYYRYLQDGTLIDTVERNGVFVVRTRLVEPGTALVGDFGHGAQLFDAGRSVIKVAEPPPGTFTEPGTAVMAQIWERVVVNLPFTFYLVTL